MFAVEKGVDVYEIQDLTGFTKGDSWELRKSGLIAFRGGFKSTVRYAVHELGFDVNDFERAVTAIIYNGHNTLHFNRNKQLVSTSYTPNKNSRTG